MTELVKAAAYGRKSYREQNKNRKVSLEIGLLLLVHIFAAEIDQMVSNMVILFTMFTVCTAWMTFGDISRS